MEIEALTAAVEALAELLGQEELTTSIDTLSHLLHEQRLTVAVDSLAREVRHLATIVDEVREEVVWSVRNPDAGTGETWRPNMTSSRVEEALANALPPPGPAKPTPVEPPPSQRGQATLFR